MGSHGLIACEHCDAVYRQPAFAQGERAECTRCGTALGKYSRLDARAWLALTLAACAVFAIANAYPVASMAVQGMTQQATLLDAVGITFEQGRFMVALMTGLSGFLLPLLQLLALLWVLLPMAFGRCAPGFAGAVRLVGLMQPWCMVPVFLLGVLVSVVKLAGMAAVAPGVGLWAFAALTVLLTMLSRLRPRVLWYLAEEEGAAPEYARHERAGGPDTGQETRITGCHVCAKVQEVPVSHHTHCVRCDALLYYRRPEPVARAWAFLIAAAILYIPANVYPVMRMRGLAGSSEHTILGGVVELWKWGSWDIALIVFVASVMVPMTKLLALAVLVFQAQRRSTVRPRQRTHMYELVERIGQWSMLDVYVVILLAALADFPGLMEISAGLGAAAFGLVVILTMLAAMSYDPRMVWDVCPDEGVPTPARHGPAVPVPSGGGTR